MPILCHPTNDYCRLPEAHDINKVIKQEEGWLSTIVHIFSDGDCSGNPGVGGYGCILRYGETEKELSGAEGMTTNNRMELTAVIVGLESLKRPCQAVVTTDSQYVVKGMTEWIFGWARNGWKTSKKEEVLNRDLWEKLSEQARKHTVQWVWVRGHDGHVENERCDELARRAIEEYRRKQA
jgi:ribonuclease HI